MALIVYGSTISPFVRKVCVALSEKGLQYTVEQVAPGSNDPGFVSASPLKKIPAFRDTSLPEPNGLADSSVICDYIEHKYPTPALYPSDPYQRARALWFEEHADTAVGNCVTRGLFFERVVKKMFKQTPDEAVCKKTIEQDLPPLYTYLETELGSNQFLVGNTFSIADISVGTMLVNMAHVGVSVDATRWPHLAAYAAKLLARPSFKTLFEAETPFVQSLIAA